MNALLLSTWKLPDAKSLASAAQAKRWQVFCLEDQIDYRDFANGNVAFYGETDSSTQIAASFGLALLEPSLDLITKLPYRYCLREVSFQRFSQLNESASPRFIKPADGLAKAFEASVYYSLLDIRNRSRIKGETPVLISEPVDWLIEYRCFVCENEIVAFSSYIRLGRRACMPDGSWPYPTEEANQMLAFTKSLLQDRSISFPPAFVVDIGMIAERGWAVVEFNPIWCAGLLGAAAGNVLLALRRACCKIDLLSEIDGVWVISRNR